MRKLSIIGVWVFIIIATLILMYSIRSVVELPQEHLILYFAVWSIFVLFLLFSLWTLTFLTDFSSLTQFLTTSFLGHLISILSLIGIAFTIIGIQLDVVVFEGLGIEMLGAFFTASFTIFIGSYLQGSDNYNNQLELNLTGKETLESLAVEDKFNEEVMSHLTG